MTKLQKLGWMMELGGIVGLATLAVKSEYKAHKERCKRMKYEMLDELHSLREICQEVQIDCLEKEVAELKAKYEPAEVEEA